MEIETDIAVGQWYRFKSQSDKKRWIRQALLLTSDDRCESDLLGKKLLRISPYRPSINFFTEDKGGNPQGNTSPVYLASGTAEIYIPTYNRAFEERKGESNMKSITEYINKHFDKDLTELYEGRSNELGAAFSERGCTLNILAITDAKELLESHGVKVATSEIELLVKKEADYQKAVEEIKINFDKKIEAVRETRDEALMLMSLATSYAEKVAILKKYGVIKKC